MNGAAWLGCIFFSYTRRIIPSGKPDTTAELARNGKFVCAHLSKFRESHQPKIPIPIVAIGIYNITDIMFIAGIANSPKLLANTNIKPTMPISAPKLLKVSPIKTFPALRRLLIKLFSP